MANKAPNPLALTLDEPTLHHVPEWALSELAGDDEPTRHSTVLPPPAPREFSGGPVFPPRTVRVAVRATLLDDALYVVRVLAPGAPLPPGTVEGHLRLDAKPELPGRR